MPQKICRFIRKVGWSAVVILWACGGGGENTFAGPMTTSPSATGGPSQTTPPGTSGSSPQGTQTDSGTETGSGEETTTSPPTDDSGFSVFEPSDDTITYYVSNNGNDGNDGLSPETPLATPLAALDLVRDGYPDWVLFRRGDIFPGLGQLTRSGRSMQEPLLLGAYGDGIERPHFLNGFNTKGTGNAPISTDYIVMVGLLFYNPQANPQDATFDPSAAGGLVSWLRGTEGLWIEDCVFRYGGLSFSDKSDGVPQRNVTLFRTQIIDAYKTTGLTQGLFAFGTVDFTLDECLVDHNGWIDGIAGGDASTQQHNIYFQVGTEGSTITDSIVMRASSHGVMFRSGGEVSGNFLFRNPISILIGGGNAEQPDGVMGNVESNVVLEGADMNTGQPRGWGIDLADVNTVTVADNILASCIGSGCWSIALGFEGATYTNNFVQDWGEGSKAGPASVTLLDYAQSVGLNSLEEFYAALRAQSKGNWNEDLSAASINAYFRAELNP